MNFTVTSLLVDRNVRVCHGFHYTTVTFKLTTVSYISLYRRHLRLDMCLMDFIILSFLEVRDMSHELHCNIVT